VYGKVDAFWEVRQLLKIAS